MFANYRPPSHHTVLCIFNSSPFIETLILMGICPVCLFSLPFLFVHTADFISNIMRGAYSGTTYVSLFLRSLFNILKCAKAITEVNAAL